MNEKLSVIIELFSDFLDEYGESPPSVTNYILCVKTLLKRTGWSLDNYYFDAIATEMISYINEAEASKLWCTGVVRFARRVAKMFCSFAKTGTCDTSRAKYNSEKYTVSEDNQELISHLIKSSDLCPSAQRDLKPVFQRFFKYISDNGLQLSDVDDDLIFEFISYVSKSGYQSMYRVNHVIRIVYNYMKENNIGKIKGDMNMLSAKESSHRIIKPFKSHEIRKLADAAELDNESPYRDRAIILLAYTTELRGCDIRKLKLENIDWRNKTLTIKQSKTGKVITNPLNDETLNAIADYILEERPKNTKHREIFISSRAPKQPLQTPLNYIANKYCDKAGIERDEMQSFHSIRRGSATDLAYEGVPLPVISEYLGHRDLSEARPYLSYTKEASDCSRDFSDVPLKSSFYINYKGDHTFSDSKHYKCGINFKNVPVDPSVIDIYKGGERNDD